MKIFDLRYRPSTRAGLDSFIKHPVYRQYMQRTAFAQSPAKSLEECVAELGALGVAKAVYTGRDCESTYGYPASNDLVFACMEAYPQIFIGFFGLDPHKGMEGLRAFREAVARGMRGASLEPAMARLPADHALFYPIYAACCDLDVPVIITAGLSPHMPGVALEATHPYRMDAVARDFPQLRLLISHGGYPCLMEAMGVAQRNANVFLDFSTCPGKPGAEILKQAGENFIADKMVFASANPFVPVAKAVADFEAMGFSPGTREKIAWKNALAFLGGI